MVIHHALQTVTNRDIRVRQKVVRIYFNAYGGILAEGRFAVLSNRYRQRRKKEYIFYSYCIHLSMIPTR